MLAYMSFLNSRRPISLFVVFDIILKDSPPTAVIDSIIIIMFRIKRGRGLFKERSFVLKNLTWLVKEINVALLAAELKV